MAARELPEKPRSPLRRHVQGTRLPLSLTFQNRNTPAHLPAAQAKLSRLDHDALHAALEHMSMETELSLKTGKPQILVSGTSGKSGKHKSNGQAFTPSFARADC